MRSSRFAVACWTLLLPAPALAAQNQVVIGSQPDSSPPARVALASTTVTVPLELINQRPTVAAFVNGQGPFKLAIETGARFSALTTATLERLGFKDVAQAGEDAEYHVDSVRIGGLDLIGMPVAKGGFSDRDIDGILGLPAYSGVLITLDYPAHEIRFAEGLLPAANGRDILPLSRVGPWWAVPIRIGEVDAKGVIDTRGATVLSVVPELASRLGFEGDPVVVGMARGAAIAPVEVKRGQLRGDLHIGGYTITRPAVSIHPLPPGFPTEPILGTPLLQQFALTLDQRQGVARLSRGDFSPFAVTEPERRGQRVGPGPGGATQEAGLPDPGFLPRFNPDGTVTVDQLLTGGPAEKLGVSVGDEVLEVAGRPASSLNLRSWRELVSADTVAVVLSHGGQRRELRIPTVRARIEVHPPS